MVGTTDITSRLAPLIGALAAAGACAQGNTPANRLEDASRVECRFSTVTSAEWDDAATGANAAGAELEAVFFEIDVETGTAEAEGRFGAASYIVVRYAQGYLHFMQTLSAGPIYLTTVLAEPTEDGRLKAVHTRHEYTEISLPGFTSRPEMYIGDCAVE